jgi:hypothetical protein
VIIKDVGYTKEKRCIPKEGMPHAHKACQKIYKKKIDSPHPWKTKKRDRPCKGVHPSSTKKKYFHTLAHLDQIV